MTWKNSRFSFWNPMHELRKRVQAGFDHILMDELQDTNPLQWRLMGLIRRPDSFFAVGDINQSIFGFRYAEPELFAAYRQALESQGKAIDELRANYRSRPEVLEIVNTTFAGPAPGIEAHELTSGRTDFIPQSELSTDIIIATGENTEAAERIESLWVARQICELAGRFQYRDMAILTRANMALGELQRALDEYRIPSLVLGGMTFYETREVRDLILLLTVLVNPSDEVALAGLLRSPLFGVSDEEILLLASGSGSLYEGVRQRPPAYWQIIDELRAIRNCVSPDQLLRRVLDDCDYESGLTSRGRANVEKFMAAFRARHAIAARLARRRSGLYSRRISRRRSASARLRRRRAADDDSQVERPRVPGRFPAVPPSRPWARARRSSAIPISMGSV